MADTKNRKRRMRIGVFVVLLGMILVALALSIGHKRSWAVPPEVKAMKNPLAPSDATITAAKRVFSDQCAN